MHEIFPNISKGLRSSVVENLVALARLATRDSSPRIHGGKVKKNKKSALWWIEVDLHALLSVYFLPCSASTDAYENCEKFRL